MNRRIDISHKTIFFATAFFAMLWALFLIRDVIILLFVAIIFMSGLAPIISWIEEKTKAPRSLAISITYLVLMAMLAGLIGLVVTPLIEQTNNLSQTLPKTIGNIIPAEFVDRQLLQQELGTFSRNALTFSLEVFGNFVAIVSVAVLTFYLLLERHNLDNLIDQFFIGHKERARRITHRIEEKLGSWLRGQIVLSLIIGVLSYIVLLIWGIPYAIPLAIIAGVMEVVPVIGPIISAVPAVLLGYTISPFIALMVGLSYLFIQQAENHFVVPQVMKKAVGLNPLFVILAVAIGSRLLGVAGALLAVPITVVIQIITQDILKEEVELP